MLLLSGVLLATATVAAEPLANTTTLNTGAIIPVVNLGGVAGAFASNFSSFLAQGGRGLDSAWDYNHVVQSQVGAAIAASGVAHSDLFVTSKVRCCQGGGTPGTGGKDDDDSERKCTPSISIADEVATDLKELGVDRSVRV
jgi:hypothetical protein